MVLQAYETRIFIYLFLMSIAHTYHGKFFGSGGAICFQCFVLPPFDHHVRQLIRVGRHRGRTGQQDTAWDIDAEYADATFVNVARVNEVVTVPTGHRWTKYVDDVRGQYWWGEMMTGGSGREMSCGSFGLYQRVMMQVVADVIFGIPKPWNGSLKMTEWRRDR